MRSGERRLCIVSPCHWTGGFGGSEQQISLLLDVLVAQTRFDITYVARQADPGFQPTGYKVEQINVSPFSSRVGNLLDARPLLAALHKIRPHVIYQRVGGAYTGIAAYYAKRNNCKLVWHISSEMNVLPFRMDKNRSSNTVSRYIEKKALEYGIRNSTSIIAQTEQQAGLLQKHYGVTAARIVPNFQPVPVEPKKQDTPVKVVWVSNLKPMKRPGLFIDLARKYQSDVDVKFIMIGRAENSLWCKQVIEEIKDVQSLDYVGERTQEEVNAILAQSHIFVNTSSYEGFPNTFIQAWMREVPVVSLDVDPDNILSSRSIGYRSGSFAALCRDLEKLIGDKQLRQSMGNAARDYAIENHSEKNIESVVKELVG